VNDAPKLLVEWSSRREEFLSALRPALGRSPQRLAGEAQTGLFPYWGILISWGFELALLVAIIVIPAKLAIMQPYEPAPKPKYDIIYYSGNELPKTEDVGGAQAGHSGRAGGREAYHPTQTIRVARGSTVRETVADAPKLNLPVSHSAVANLLALKALPGPAPAEGMRSSQRAPTLAQMAVAPAPQVLDQLRTAPILNPGVVPPSAAAPQRELVALHLPGSQAVQVVPPPVSAPEQMTKLNPTLALPAPSVIAPAPTITREVTPMGPGFGADQLQKQIVPPTVQLGTSAEHRTVSGLGSNFVVPPTVQLGAGFGQRSMAGGMGSGTAVVPPAPSFAAGGSITGPGRGNRGTGFGGALDAGLAAAPPSSNGGGSTSGVVVSNQPGSKVGMPGNGGSGALAMSPAGGDKPGLGGAGGGAGIGHGDGPGSGFAGPGSGAGKEGAGPGSDPKAHGGISPYPGSGGAGTGTNGSPAMPGVSVKGGSSNIVTLPSFGSGASQSGAPARSQTGAGNRGPDITVVATSRSGGAFNFYGRLKGDKVYTIYIATALPTVMSYADPASAAHGYAEDLTAPQAMRSDLPAGLPRTRLVIECVLDRSGLLRRPRVLEPASAVMTSKVLAALISWKFSPALRGDQPIEVSVILGFNINTDDQF
jgi:hypothetical protein